MEVFRNLILTYNERLNNLCNLYGITFVDTLSVGKKYNHSGLNFHVSTSGHYALANNIIELMHENEFGSNDNSTVRSISISECEISSDGTLGVLHDTLIDYGENCDRVASLFGYVAIMTKEIAKEPSGRVGFLRKC